MLLHWLGCLVPSGCCVTSVYATGATFSGMFASLMCVEHWLLAGTPGISHVHMCIGTVLQWHVDTLHVQRNPMHTRLTVTTSTCDARLTIACP
jgi:hypothetical protein